MFEMSWSPLVEEHPEWGKVSLLPWDCEIFGFAVAEFAMGECSALVQNREAFKCALEGWAQQNQVELISCSIPGADAFGCFLLAELGFRYIDYTYTIKNSRIHEFVPPASRRRQVRPAEPGDYAEIERIAEHAFQFGRYQLDPLFPREAADRRYRLWLRNTCATLGGSSIMHVIGDPGQVRGFLHATIEGQTSHISIMAVDASLQLTSVGLDLCSSHFREMQQMGIRRMDGKISASNLNILNMVAFFGFRFYHPLAAFHWHAPDAPHLVRLGTNN